MNPPSEQTLEVHNSFGGPFSRQKASYLDSGLEPKGLSVSSCAGQCISGNSLAWINHERLFPVEVGSLVILRLGPMPANIGMFEPKTLVFTSLAWEMTNIYIYI